MKKSIVTLALGIFIGVAASYAGPAVAAVKQYILNDKEAQKEVVADGIRIQRHMNTNYFSISDLEKQLGIKS